MTRLFVSPFFSVSRPLTLAGLLVAAFGLAACAENRPLDGLTYPYDTRERHPILLSEAPVRLDVFPRSATGLDARQAADVRAYGAAFRADTMGAIQVAVPTVAGRPTAIVTTTARGVRANLAAAGVGARSVRWVEYDATSLGPQSPLLLSHAALTAGVPHACGDWPYDLAAGAGIESFRNEPYWNLGCATQSSLALQVADPVDLVRPRVEGPADTVKRVNDINALRAGQDPSTQYAVPAVSPSGTGNN